MSTKNGLKNSKAVREIRKVISTVRTAHLQLRKLVKDRMAIAEAKEYTDRFRKGLVLRLGKDIARAMDFLERARRELKVLQKQYVKRPSRRRKRKTPATPT